MPAHATPEGTRRYAQRFAGRAAQGHYRPAQGLALSSIGIGTYLGDADEAADRAYTQAVAEAVRRGVNVIDSAINYRLQRSERSVGATLRELAAEGFSRDEIVLCTKGGYLTPDGTMPLNPRNYFLQEYFAAGVMKPQDVAAGCHVMTPGFLANQLERSLRNLGVEALDVYYLHNPETQLSAVDEKEFRARVRAAFAFFESVADSGKLRFYGMATWNAFRQPEDAVDYIALEAMEALAREVAGEGHRFRFVQLPFNAAMTEALVLPNQPLGGHRVPLLVAAQELGVTVVGSASLMQMHVARGLPRVFQEVLGLENDLHRALQFARSAPGLTTALVGMGRAEHVRQNLEIAAVPPAPLQLLLRLFSAA
jgi:aryl-alcohol dehydrogenase-like predicted oxidoreductase